MEQGRALVNDGAGTAIAARGSRSDLDGRLHNQPRSAMLKLATLAIHHRYGRK
jgi:hypothetical protein